MSVGHKIIYIPIGKDARGIDLISPIYLPIVVDDPQTVYATGSLSDKDFISTLKLYNLRPEDAIASAGGNEVGGFPLAPIIAALAPIAIPPLITAAKKLFGKKSSNGMYDTYSSGDSDINDLRTIEDRSIELDSDEQSSGYIPTNPNIKNLKQLQVLYDKYN